MAEMNINPQQIALEQIDAIANANGEVYRRDIIRSTFKTRTQGFWAGSGLGLVYGAMMGSLVALSTVLVGVPLLGAVSVMSILPIVTGTFALAGMAMGRYYINSGECAGRCSCRWCKGK